MREGLPPRGGVTFRARALPSSQEAARSRRQPRGFFSRDAGNFLPVPLNPRNTDTPSGTVPSTDLHPVAEGTVSLASAPGRARHRPRTSDQSPASLLTRQQECPLDPSWPETMGLEELLVVGTPGCPELRLRAGLAERAVPRERGRQKLGCHVWRPGVETSSSAGVCCRYWCLPRGPPPSSLPARTSIWGTRARERRAPRAGGACRENGLRSRSSRPAGTAPLDTGRQAEGTGARGPGLTRHRCTAWRSHGPPPSGRRPATMLSCAHALLPAPSSYVVGGGLALETGAPAWTPALQGGRHVLPVLPRQRSPTAGASASRGFCPRCGQSYGACAVTVPYGTCVCSMRVCACVPCLETCTQALDSCHCVPVCSVAAGRDPSLVRSGS